MTAVPVDFLRPISAAQAPLWATVQVRTRLVPLSPAPHPARLDPNPGLAMTLPDGGGTTVVVVVVGGGTVVVVGRAVVVVGPAPLTAYDVDDTLSAETSTASNAEPGTARSRLRSSSFQPGSGAPLMNHDEPL